MSIPKRFEMQAPHGTRIFPSMTGCVIEYTDEMRQAVLDWFKFEIDRFEQFSATKEELIPCPRCGGKLEMKEGIPVVCTLCHGRGKVTKPMAEAYQNSLNQGLMVVRQQSVPPIAATLDFMKSNATYGKALMSSTTIDTEGEENFQAPQPGEPGFVGPIQET